MHLELSTFTNWLHQHPEWGGIAAFIVAFAESIAVIGTIIPGSITMTAIGILVGSGTIPIVSTLIFAIAGAVVGDSLSYAAGFYFKQHIQNMWPFRKHPEWLARAKAFFAKHGGKSVFMGRFIGPIRAMIPIIAGMLHMKPIRFFPVDIAAAILWAPAYLFPGYLVGLASAALPADIATKLIFLVLGLLVLFWLLAWLIKKCSSYVTYGIDSWLNKIWDKMLASKKCRWICRALRDEYKPTHHGQLVLAFVALVSGALFIVLFINVVFHGAFTGLNPILYHLARGFKTEAIDIPMIWISTLGEKFVLIPTTIIIFAWLLIVKKPRAAWHFLFAIGVSAALALLFRHLFYSPRPPGIETVKTSSSFPSGHITLTTAFYGFLAWLICLRKPKLKRYVYPTAFIIILLVAISRVYLGDHWLTDVIGGFLLSITCIVIVAISFQTKKENAPHAMSLFIVALASILIIGLVYTKMTFESQFKATQLSWHVRLLNTNAWWNERAAKLPLYRNNRIGHPVAYLNLQWAGSITDIHHDLLRHGWIDLRSKQGDKLLAASVKAGQVKRLDLLPALFDDQKAVITMVKHISDKTPMAIIRLWPAHIILQPDHMPLWIGSVHFQRPNKALLFHRAYQLFSQEEALSLIHSSLHNEKWQIKHLDKNPLLDKLSRIPMKVYYVIMVRPS